MRRKLTPDVLEAIRAAREDEALPLAGICSRFGVSKGTAYAAFQALGLGKLSPTAIKGRERRVPTHPELQPVVIALHHAPTKVRGDAAEAVVLAELVKAGKVVLLPFGDKERYDLVVQASPGHFVRIQCKSAWSQPSRPHVVTFSIAHHQGHARKVAVKYTRAEIDGIAVWVPAFNRLLWIPVAALERYQGEKMSVNFDASAQGKWSVNSPEDFPFEGLLNM